MALNIMPSDRYWLYFLGLLIILTHPFYNRKKV